MSKIGRQCLSRNETKCTGHSIKPSCGNITASTSICLRLNSPAEIDTRYLVNFFHDKIMQLRSILCCHMFENTIYIIKCLDRIHIKPCLIFICIYQFAVTDLREPPLFWVGSVGLCQHNILYCYIAGVFPATARPFIG